MTHHITTLPLPAASLGRASLSVHVRFWIVALALVGLIFASIAPTLPILNFSNGSEGLNVSTVQEMHRTGERLIPRLQNRLRLAKPPLTAWFTSLFVADETMSQTSSTDAAVRDKAFRQLAWQMRWPMVTAGCITLLLTAELGRIVGGPACGIASLVVAGSSLMFLRFVRYSSTDVPLMLSVALTNVFLAYAIILGRRWIGCIGAGIALGLAMMTKGPVAIVQSLLPFVLWAFWDHRRNGESRPPGLAPVLTGILLFVILGSWWFVMVYFQEPRALSIWWQEITREGATDAPPDDWYNYFSLIPLMLPWSLLLVLGVIAIWLKRMNRPVLPLLLLIVPILVMSFAKDKPERYLLPMLPAAAIVTGFGLTAFAVPPLIVAGHWVILAVFAIGFPIAAMLFDPPWIPLNIGALVLIAATLILCTCLGAARRFSQAAVIPATLLIMLGVQVIFVNGYRHTSNGRAELRPLAETIASHYPTATVWNGHPTGKRPPPELGVYLNRTLEAVAGPQVIQPGSEPQIILLRQNRGDPQPTLPPPWRFVDKAPRNEDWWWAFVLPPQ